ncbi:rhomboid family intramembrane serine protease [Patulibacter defluvii]|uniref:rhomboid family intramembrane serine protease n=1 Tax=Patulibacter defluvii TaxID=3095358 RepID=UPI002A75E5B5|nr:rhomboid family intramembrane serine protease [Patulibacter sp. DM4]
MAGAAELFTVCRSCGQQVSSFVTECPYCGTRLRRRAPRLERKDGDLEALLQDPAADEPAMPADPDDEVVVPLRKLRRRGRTKPPKPPKAGKPPKARRGSRLRREPRRRTSAYDGIGERRPWVTLALVLVSLIGIPVAQVVERPDLLLFGGLAGDMQPWRYAVAPFVYASAWHALAIVGTLGVFGWLWERRAGLVGSLVVLLTFVVAGAGGLALAAQADGAAFYCGAGGAATALATAWIVAELRARQRRESVDGDLLGAATMLVVALAVSAVAVAGAPLAAVLGVVVGLPLGLALSAAGK